MSLPAPVAHAARTFLRATLTADLDRLASVSLPHPELAALLPRPTEPADVAATLDALTRQPLRGSALAPDRWLVHADAGVAGDALALLVVHTTPAGARVDARYPLAARQPDDDRRRTARAFHRALVVGDLAVLTALAFEPRGLEVLARHAPPPSERDRLLASIDVMPLIELRLGESFAVPHGVQFVSSRHAEMGIHVLHGLLPTGEIPFLLRQATGAWKVIAFHFIQGAATLHPATHSV